MTTNLENSKDASTNAIKKPHFLMVLLMLMLFLLFMYLTFVAIGLRSPEGNLEGAYNSLVIGQMVGAFIVPIFIVCLFQIFRRFRNSRSHVNILVWTLVLLCFSTAGGLIDAEEQGLQSWLQQESMAANKSLPVMVDESTRFDSTKVSKRSFERHYTIIDITESEIDEATLKEFENNMRTTILQAFCNNDLFFEMRREGVKLADIYSEKNGKLLIHIISDPKDCSPEVADH